MVRKWLVSLVVVGVLLLALVPAMAQTPVPLTTTDITDGALDMIGMLGLFALVSVVAFIGIARMMVRAFRSAAR